MGQTIGGEKPKPRVALLGVFKEEEQNSLRKMFPTVYTAKFLENLNKQVDAREIDLIVIGENINDVGYSWKEYCHIVCFSSDINSLPGPFQETELFLNKQAETEAFIFSDLPLFLARIREADFSEINGIRGWPIIESRIQFQIEVGKNSISKEILKKGCILAEKITGNMLSIYFTRRDKKLGVAWLPNTIYSKHIWVHAILQEWAKLDSESFPNFSDWQSSPEWMTSEESVIQSKINEVEEIKKNQIIEYDNKIAGLQESLVVKSNEVNKSERRLITSQSDELVEEVIKAFRKIGFSVKNIDESLKKGKQKREDLQLIIKKDNEWIAIVEVRGYSRSSGKTSDLQRLRRFATLYKKEIDEYPQKMIYVVNGQIDVPPTYREKPLKSAAEDVKVFAEDLGLVIWTLDLYKAIYVSKLDIDKIRNSIVKDFGYWNPY